MKEKVKCVMEFIHKLAYDDVGGDRYVEFLELIEYELGKELDGGDLLNGEC